MRHSERPQVPGRTTTHSSCFQSPSGKATTVPQLTSTEPTLAETTLPVPLRGAWKAAREVLQVAPDELDQLVQQVMQQFVATHRFEGFTSHVAKIGRMHFVEIHILTRPDTQLGSIGDVDRLRDEIAAQLDARSGRFWLTIDFTSDPAWT